MVDTQKFVLDPKIDGPPGENPVIDRLYDIIEREGISDEQCRGIDDFVERFRNSWQPSSAKYHNNILWGNWIHTVDAIDTGTMINRVKGLGWDPLDIIITLLIHDSEHWLRTLEPVLRVNIKNKSEYTKDRKTGKPECWKYVNSNELYIPHEIQSLMIGLEHFKLKDYQIQAIIYHTGPWSKDINWEPWPKANVQCRFAYYIHLIDNLQANGIEEIYTPPPPNVSEDVGDESNNKSESMSY